MALRLGTIIQVACLAGLLGAAVSLIVGVAQQHYPLLLVGVMGVMTMVGVLLHQVCSGGGSSHVNQLESDLTSNLVNGAYIATVASLSSGPTKKTELDIELEERLNESDLKKHRTHMFIH